MCFLNKPHLSEIHAKRVSTKQGLTVLQVCFRSTNALLYQILHTYLYLYAYLNCSKQTHQQRVQLMAYGKQGTNQPTTAVAPQSNNDVSTQKNDMFPSLYSYAYLFPSLLSVDDTQNICLLLALTYFPIFLLYFQIVSQEDLYASSSIPQLLLSRYYIQRENVRNRGIVQNHEFPQCIVLRIHRNYQSWLEQKSATWTAQTDLAKYDHMAIKSSIINDRFLCMIVRNEKKIFVLFHCWRNFFMSVVSLLIRENKKSNSTTIENLINQQCN